MPLAARCAELALSTLRVFPMGSESLPATLDRPLAEVWPGGRRPAPEALSIAVHKAKRRLDLQVNGQVVKSYLVNLGPSPVGDKEREGDGRTPEGDLFVCSKNAHSRFTRFLGLAYPSPAHVARAAASGRGSASLGRATSEAYARRDRCPPQSTGLGGAVGIHGSGAWARTPSGFRVVDWTLGCIGLRDADILELFEVVPVGTPVHVTAE